MKTKKGYCIIVLLFAFLVFASPSLAQSLRKPSLERQITKSGPDPRKFPFIQFSSGGWVRADMPSESVITTCAIANRTFSCLVEEKKRYERNLQELEKDLKFRPKGKKAT